MNHLFHYEQIGKMQILVIWLTTALVAILGYNQVLHLIVYGLGRLYDYFVLHYPPAW